MRTKSLRRKHKRHKRRVVKNIIKTIKKNIKSTLIEHGEITLSCLSEFSSQYYSIALRYVGRHYIQNLKKKHDFGIEGYISYQLSYKI